MDSSKKVRILFGTQTGNSEDVAERIGRQITRMNCKAYVSNLADFPVAGMLEETLIIFVCSTTGNGEFPDNMKHFWRFMLRKNLPSNSLCHLNFCVFGLGDSSYEKFNVVAKKLSKRLNQLGAAELIPLTLADDQHELGYDAALDPWLLKLQDMLKDFYCLSDDAFQSDDVPLPPKYKAVFTNEHQTNNNSNVHRSTTKMMATLKTNKRVTSTDHFQAVHLLEFAIDEDVRYAPGDVAVVWPENDPEYVDDFLALLNVSPDEPFVLRPSDPEFVIPNIDPCTARRCATSYFDIKSVPRRSFFEFFHHFSRDETEKEKLVEFTTAAGQEELYDYCNRPRRNILEVLKDFPNTTPHVPFDYLFDAIPAIRPRSFSVASSLRAHPREFHLLVAVVEYRTRLLAPRKGLCSNWLARLLPGTSIPFALKSGSIALPGEDVPIVLVGPGTGCAPFRSFVEERSLDGIAENYLFFGCRYKDKDFLFSETWEDFVRKRTLRIFTAFSRDQEDKVYVQHRIAEHGRLVWDVVDGRGGAVYVAGSAKRMPEGVREALLEVLRREGGMEEGEGVRYLQRMESEKRYQVETWA